MLSSNKVKAIYHGITNLILGSLIRMSKLSVNVLLLDLIKWKGSLKTLFCQHHNCSVTRDPLKGLHWKFQLCANIPVRNSTKKILLKFWFRRQQIPTNFYSPTGKFIFLFSQSRRRNTKYPRVYKRSRYSRHVRVWVTREAWNIFAT